MGMLVGGGGIVVDMHGCENYTLLVSFTFHNSGLVFVTPCDGFFL